MKSLALSESCAAAILSIAVTLAAAKNARADEGGAGFWLPGQMGSLAAAPSDPGLSLPVIYYHTSQEASVAHDFEIGLHVEAGLNADADLFMLAPSYVFSAPVLGGQAAVGITTYVGHLKVDVDAALTGPGGTPVIGASTSDSLNGVGDLFPTASLKWNRGVHNFMLYTMAGVPVGDYNVNDLANLGLNHWSLDGGGGYTYLDPEKGHEFTAVLGFTYNWENHTTEYRNGDTGHLDWAASQFLSERLHVGVAGYFYEQLTGDSGAGAQLGGFESRVAGVGPQLGYLFPVGDQKWYVNLKAFDEFDAKNRPSGWNAWLVVVIPLAGRM